MVCSCEYNFEHVCWQNPKFDNRIRICNQIENPFSPVHAGNFESSFFESAVWMSRNKKFTDILSIFCLELERFFYSFACPLDFVFQVLKYFEITKFPLSTYLALTKLIASTYSIKVTFTVILRKKIQSLEGAFITGRLISLIRN